LNPNKKKGNKHKGFMFNQKRDDLEGEGEGRGVRGCQTKKEIKKKKPYLTSFKPLNPP
jgi:hypothetical protein